MLVTVPHLAAFLVVAALIVITPGPDMALVASNALNRGRRAALLTAAGVCVGLLVWTAASAAGIAALLSTSALAFTIVKLCGAGYLIVLGVVALAGARRKQDKAAPAQVRRLGGPPFRQGLLCNLLNPKIAVLFTSLIPQFVTRGPDAAWQSAGLAGIFVGMGAVWLTGFALATSAANGLLRSPRVQRVQRAITGTALVGLGVRLAAQTR